MESYKFVDIHAHLGDRVFDTNREELLGSLGDYIILNCGEDTEENERIFEESAKYNNLLPCIGMHPNKISHYDQNSIRNGMHYLEDNINRAFAVSEIGLDYKQKDDEQIRLQKEVLSNILELAEKHNKVCIVHSRKAIEDVMAIVSSFHTEIILHNFEGNLIQLRKALDHGLHPSISTGFIRFKKDNVIKAMKPGEFFVESDSPVLSPNEKMNTPLNIPILLEYISGLLRVTKEELKSSIYLSFTKVFYG